MRTETTRHRPSPAGAVYGTVVAGSVMVVESSDEVDVSHLSVVVIATLAIYWLAHVYAEVLGVRVREQRAPSRDEVRTLAREESSILGASLVPLAALLVATAVGADGETAVDVAVWSIVLVLASWTFVAGRRSRLQGWELASYVVLSAAFGCAVVVLKALLH